MLAAYGDRVALLTVSGASNVTGFIQPIHRLARKAHAVGARILVDAAQLAPHRRIDVKSEDDPEHLDYVVLSAHKMYAPFGTGALVGRSDTFLQGAPEHQGGGTVEIVTPTDVYWAGLPDREEAGSPNVVGAVAMAVAAQALMDHGMDDIARHERALTAYALDRLQAIPGLTIYGAGVPVGVDDRVGVIAFNLESVPHALVAAILGYEGGIGVRNGCFCAQSYVAHLLGIAAAGRRGGCPNTWQRTEQTGRAWSGSVSASTTHEEDVDALAGMLERIVRRDYRGVYSRAPDSSDYSPAGYHETILDCLPVLSGEPFTRSH